ncbi:MAG: hypothetical protein IPN61_18705 [Bacteroidetes bacterium]|nr:hypothetical protein [Bacteroidota bacterium]
MLHQFHAVEITQNTGMLYCGHYTRIWINYTNTGSVTDSGEVILKSDTIGQYNGGVPTALQFDDSVAVWNFFFSRLDAIRNANYHF